MNTTTVELSVNDLVVNAHFYHDNIDEIIMPLLKRLTELQKKLNRRVIVLLAASPAAGKTTLLAYLEHLSKNTKELTNIQALPMDGFHYKNRYLKTHHINKDINAPLLYSKKGSVETFNVNKLESYIKKIKTKDIIWPVYSRISHDASNDGFKVTEKIVFIEGNYLLLNKGPFSNLAKYADFTIFIKSDKEAIKKHSIERKHSSGSSLQEAIDHYEKIDKVNAEFVLNNCIEADLQLACDSNMHYSIIKTK